MKAKTSVVKDGERVPVIKRKPTKYIVLGESRVGRSHSLGTLLKNRTIISLPPQPDFLFNKKTKKKVAKVKPPIPEKGNKAPLIKEQTDLQFMETMAKQIAASVKSSRKGDYSTTFDLMARRIQFLKIDAIKQRSKYSRQLRAMQNMDKSNPARKGRYGDYFYTMTELKALVKRIDDKMTSIDNARTFCRKMQSISAHSFLLK